MKKIISVLGLTAALLTSGMAVAAEQKVVIVDVVSILQQMPQREGVAKALDAEFEARAKTLQDEEIKVNEAAQRLKKDALTLSASEKAKLTGVITAFEEKAKAFSQDYRRRESEEANKLLVKIQEAVKTLAQKEKYTLVLKAEAAFYAEGATDITDKVLQQVK